MGRRSKALRVIESSSSSPDLETPQTGLPSEDEQPRPPLRFKVRPPRGRKAKHANNYSGRISDLLSLQNSPSSTRDTTPAQTQDDDDDDEEDENEEPPLPSMKITTKRINGRNYVLRSDELVLDDDPAGESKIDRNGKLQGGREFVFHTFNSDKRSSPEQLYCLAIEAARAVGFRDTLKFFQRNPLLHKVLAYDIEKEKLVSEGRMHPNLRIRPVALIGVRNAFKIFGAKFIKNGKYVTDDYYEEASRNAGNIEGSLAVVLSFEEKESAKIVAKDPLEKPTIRNLLGRFEDVASIRDIVIDKPEKTQFGGNGLAPYAKWDVNSKQRKPGANLTEINWAYEYAATVSEANKQINAYRKRALQHVVINAERMTLPEDQPDPTDFNDQSRKRSKLDIMTRDDDMIIDEVAPVAAAAAQGPIGILDAVTNTAHIPQSTQPSSAYWEQLSNSSARRVLFSVEFASQIESSYAALSHEQAEELERRPYRPFEIFPLFDTEDVDDIEDEELDENAV